jgi:hypothetical protein
MVLPIKQSAMHVPLILQGVTPASIRLAVGLVKAKIFELDEIQFFSSQASVYTRESYTKHAMGLCRETNEQIIDASLRRYCHFSDHTIAMI